MDKGPTRGLFGLNQKDFTVPRMAPIKSGAITMTYPTTHLNNLADIRTGFTFREAIKEEPESGLRMLQIADIKTSVLNECSTLPEIHWSPNKPPQTLKPNDIVIVARGANNRAAIYKAPDQVIPTNQLMVVTCTSNDLLPDYLCWLLNYNVIKRQLIEARTGTNIPSLKKGDLQLLEITLPPIAIQQKILEINELGQKELETLQQLQHNTETMLNGMFSKLLNGEAPE